MSVQSNHSEQPENTVQVLINGLTESVRIGEANSSTLAQMANTISAISGDLTRLVAVWENAQETSREQLQIEKTKTEQEYQLKLKQIETEATEREAIRKEQREAEESNKTRSHELRMKILTIIGTILGSALASGGIIYVILTNST